MPITPKYLSMLSWALCNICNESILSSLPGNLEADPAEADRQGSVNPSCITEDSALVEDSNSFNLCSAPLVIEYFLFAWSVYDFKDLYDLKLLCLSKMYWTEYSE